MKTIILLLDGLGDRPQKQLLGKTPLEAANTPNLNSYLRKSYHLLKNHAINKKRVRGGKQLANFLLTKWADKKPNLLSFEEKHGMKGEIIGSSKLMYGIMKQPIQKILGTK